MILCRWILFIILVSSFAHAGERFEFYNGVRALGMGGATIAAANDETALITNPAALGKLRDYYLTVVDPEIDISEDSQSVVDADLFAFTDPQETLDNVGAKPHRRFYQRAQVFPSLVLRNFGIGFLGKHEMSAAVNPTTNNVDMTYINDYAAILGFNFRFFGGIIKFGGSGRLINRTTLIRDNIPNTETNLTIDSQGKEGVGLAGDAALMIAAPVTWLPTLAVVYRDVGHTRYDLGGGQMHSTSDSPDSTQPTLDVGFSLFPILGKGTRMTFAAEVRDVMKEIDDGQNGRSEDDIQRRLHAGLEFNFGDALFLRAGMNQQYWTAGLEIALYNYQLQFASYGEEVGTAADTKEDRRYVGKFSWRF